MKIAILGSGKWGSAIAMLYAHKFKDQQLHWWMLNEEVDGINIVEHAIKERENLRGFPEIPIPENLIISDNFEEATKDADIIISVIPSAFVKTFIDKLKDTKAKYFINASKGFVEENTIHQYFKKTIQNTEYATISGPNIAGEVVENFKEDAKEMNPAFATLAYDNEEKLKELQEVLEYKPYFRLYPEQDIDAVEYCGILKQPYSMALGIIEEAKVKTNTFVALFHRCGEEIKQILESQGNDSSTFSRAYAGRPDLEVTFKAGRNGKVGRSIVNLGVEATKEKFKNECIEGFNILSVMHKKIQESNLNLPILNMVYEIVNNNKDPKEEVKKMLLN